jgi:biopolymer transport protein ExbB
VTADNGQIILYADGNPTSTLAAALPTMTGTALLGGDAPASAPAPAAPDGAPPAEAAGGNPPEGAGATAAPGSAGFVGVIDELQIAKVARPAGFIKLAAIGQGSDQAKLISYSVDEETASWFSGYFAIILKSVTLDGWVVIGLLTIMAVVSWIVMINKISYLNRVGRANALFLKHFGEAAVDLDSLLHLDEAEEGVAGLGDLVAKKDRKTIRNSSLYRLFHRGMQEIRRRFSVEGRARTLSAQSIQAIRAALDSNYVRETQRLNRAMVVLTIAISGGPFLGLLGTVIGVMITFASIAASGDVNVNAIAPGISAALVATVAGLGVAIPALFGYNYLITRIKNTTSDMHVFIDEFVTRMAESYHARTDDPQRIAAE